MTAAEQLQAIRVTLVEPASAHQHWQDCFRPMIADALAKSPLSSDEPHAVLDKIMATQAMLLQIDNGTELLACAVVELAQGKAGPLLHVYAVAGVRMNEWLDTFIDKLRAIAAKLGAVAISMTGRPGWCKELPSYGFQTELITMTARVSQ